MYSVTYELEGGKQVRTDITSDPLNTHGNVVTKRMIDQTDLKGCYFGGEEEKVIVMKAGVWDKEQYAS